MKRKVSNVNRCDYEEVETEKANRVIDHLRDLVGPSKNTFFGKTFGEFTVKDGDDFEYRDPVDGSISSHQVIITISVGGALTSAHI